MGTWKIAKFMYFWWKIPNFCAFWLKRGSCGTDILRVLWSGRGAWKRGSCPPGIHITLFKINTPGRTNNLNNQKQTNKRIKQTNTRHLKQNKQTNTANKKPKPETTKNKTKQKKTKQRDKTKQNKQTKKTLHKTMYVFRAQDRLAWTFAFPLLIILQQARESEHHKWPNILSEAHCYESNMSKVDVWYPLSSRCDLNMKDLSSQLSSNDSAKKEWNIADILQSSTDFIDGHLQLFQVSLLTPMYTCTVEVSRYGYSVACLKVSQDHH